MPTLRLGRRVFAPRLLPTLLLLPLLALLLGLGHWQLGRAAEKRALVAAFRAGSGPALPLGAAPAPRYAHVAVAGRYLGARQFLLDNMTHAGVAGYRVWTPLERADGSLLLVDRGWLPVGASRAVLPPLDVDGAARTLTGRIDDLPRAGLRLAGAIEPGWPRRVAYPTWAELEAALGRPLAHVLVLLDAGAADGFVRDWQPPAPGPERHLGYALQWFALALTLLVAWFVVHLKRPEGPR
ncbi:MAG: SURF1 family protein [Proteobacteria bacterium]|nr:SURF1 family protein [Pseudomonadota bacterium]